MSVRIIPHPSGRSKNWYVRITVPVAIQSLIGKKEVRRTTGTADRTRARAEAARIEAELRAQWQPLLDDARYANTDAHDTILSPALIQQICGAWLASWEFTDRFERTEWGLDDEELAAVEEFCRYSDAAMRSVLAQGKAGKSWPDVVETVTEFAGDMGYLVHPTDPLFPDLVRSFAKAEKTAQEIIALRNRGDDLAFPVTEPRGSVLSEMVAAYEEHRAGAVTPKTISKNVSIWRRFVAFSGDVALDSITHADIYNFLSARLKDPDDGWSQGYVDGHAKRALRDMFALARTQGRMSAPNPVNGVETTPTLSRKEQEARKRPRYPFSAQQLTELFASEWYDPGATVWTGKMRGDLAARYWGPLIATCHGSRVREVVQLVSHDFKVVHGVLLMTIQTSLLDDGESELEALPERSLKNASTYRTVPVHPTLCALGFREFIDSFQEAHAPTTPLFASAVPLAGGRAPVWGRPYEQALLRHVRDRLGFGNGFGNHSFRHQVEDRIRAAQVNNGVWPAGLAEFYTGRKLPRKADQQIFREQSSAIDYGEGFKPQHLLGYVGQITFDDVVLPVPYSQWLARAGK
ncbi:DUF6538 domain-containing protein [Paraburkholderia phytofirmans]|uniref:DUF6538 domain-containing protein n=1 Tax=Paraburkholderia phytofirmans TaxID=261302 RepID=UPI0011E06057|nr:DUF6538 domain-containing protein [Paraburkholderia phytofirmans]